MRLHNLDEESSKTVNLYEQASKLCSLLNSFAGRNDIVIESVTELSLFTTKQKSQVQKNKLDPKVSDLNNPNDGKVLTLEISHNFRSRTLFY